MYKIDLHTHSTASPDGGISRLQYQKILHTGQLDYVAVTDHNTISFAHLLHKEFGDRVIIGEEIMTSAGEIIGLYLEEVIEPGLTPLETVKRIKEQNGIVYIPHPFETVRKGIRESVLNELIDYVDLIEVYNGRAFAQNRKTTAAVWSRLHQVTGVASSDAHGPRGIGRTHTQITQTPNRDTILAQLAKATLHIKPPTLPALLYPKYHRLRKKLRRAT